MLKPPIKPANPSQLNALLMELNASSQQVAITTLPKFCAKVFFLQNLFLANLATSGAKSCLWSEGKCIDKVCSDAPKTLTTKI